MEASNLPAFYIRTVETLYKDQHIYFYEFSEDMTDLLFLINSASGGGETLHFHMNNCGGDVHAGVQLIFAVEEAMLHGVQVIVYIEGVCVSMGAVFVSALITMGAEVHIGKAQYLMFHNSSMSNNSNTCTNLAKEAEEVKALSKHMLETYCHSILLKDEITRILNGEEIYLRPEMLLERIKSIVPTGETVH